MKKIPHLAVFLFLMALSVNTHAQSYVDSLNWQLRALFGNLAKPSPPKLFNWDMAIHTVDSSLFIPINYVDTLDVNNWHTMYTEMRNSAYDTIPLITADSILNHCYTYGADTINVPLMFYDYYRFKSNALTTNIYFNFDTINNILTDKTVRPGFPYDIFKVFAASPISNTAARNQVIFRFAPENMFYDQFNPLDANAYANGTKLRVNFNEGSGWHQVILGQENFIPIYYIVAGNYPIDVEVTNQHGENDVLVARSTSFLKIRKTRKEPYEDPDDILSLYGLNINVYEPCDLTTPQFQKTLIYLEGFDFGDFTPFTNRTAQSIYEDQIVDTKLSDLQNFGYRIFVVDWKNSRIDMRANAKNLNDFIEYLKCGNIIPDNNMEEFVIMGESMGGIVANYALLQQENGQYDSECKPRKMHNTRLLLTLDSPFQGAVIPMGVQKIAQLVSTNLPGLLAPALPLILKQYYVSHNLFNDGMAAKQLLMYHIDGGTAPLYGPKAERTSFLNDQINLGGHPKFCKIVAASNGNMLGLGQTRYWDGADRTAGDRLLDLSYTTYCKIKGIKIPIVKVNMTLNTDPNGAGQIASLSLATWSIKIKLKLFGIKIKITFHNVLSETWKADMVPASTSAGGILDINPYLINPLIGNKTYQGSGLWASSGTTKFGIDASFQTDGLHWCFVPTASALDFDGPSSMPFLGPLNVPYDNLGVNNIFGHVPFDVMYGRPGSQIFAGTTSPVSFGSNPDVANSPHVNVRNEILLDLNGDPIVYPTVCPTTGGNMIRAIRMLNREMGDNEIYLENRYLPWDAACSINDAISVNVRSDFYTYASTTTTASTIESMYSRENPYIIDPWGFNAFTTNTGNVNYQSPFSGPFSTPIEAFQACCEDYFRSKQSNPVVRQKVTRNDLSIFPNPATIDFVVNFIPNNIGALHYQIVDLMGKTVYGDQAIIHDKNVDYFLPIHLPYSLPSGAYIFQAVFNDQVFTKKIIIQ